MKTRPTVEDVAKLAGVSPSTVSRALSGRIKVSPQKKQRVMEAAKMLGYRPDTTARALRIGEVSILGLIVPDIRNPFFADLIQGTEDFATSHGFNLFVGSTTENPDRARGHLTAFLTNRVAGMLIATSDSLSQDSFQNLAEEQAPTVFLARGSRKPPRNWVGTDHRAGGEIAARHLIELGHRHMAVLTGPTEIDVYSLRKEGFIEHASSAGVTLVVREGKSKFEDGYLMMKSILSGDARSIPSAVFAASDLLAIGAMRAAIEAGYSIPDEISILGFDGLDIGKYVIPPLTTVSQSGYEIGYQGCELLLKLVRGEAEPQGPIVLKPSLEIRATTAPPPAAR